MEFNSVTQMRTVQHILHTGTRVAGMTMNIFAIFLLMQ